MSRRRSIHDHVFGLIIAVGVGGGVLAFLQGTGVQPLSQLAVGNESDVQCMGGADASCPCGKGPAKKCNKKGGGKIGCTCIDITSGYPTTGKCAAVGKCKGEKTDGMPPMLPMLPMPEMPKQDCSPKNATTTATTTTSSERRSADVSATASDPNCSGAGSGDFSGGGYPSVDYGAYQSGGGGSASDTGNIFGGTGGDDSGTGLGSKAAALWQQLKETLGVSQASDVSESTGPASESARARGAVGLQASRGGVALRVGESPGGSGGAPEYRESAAGPIYQSSGSTFAQANPVPRANYASYGTEHAENPFVVDDESAPSFLEYLMRILRALLALIVSWTR